jgi:oligopeptide/dipeptide ABC transporter ATP-binding protein
MPMARRSPAVREVLLRAEDLVVHYDVGGGLLRSARGVVRAIDGIDLEVHAGEVLALVGESGCGKSTTARALLGLVAPTGGRILFQGEDVSHQPRADRLRYRRHVQMVFQDPFDSLNPRKTVLQTIVQPLRIHRIVPPGQMRTEAVRLLDSVGMSPGAAYLDRYPHQFSGGQRQRICIARAIATRPQVIVADEAVSALDVSIRAQILELFRDLSARLGLACIFITHDLSVVRSLSARVAVMYLGKIVEQGATDAIFTLPRHPYTRALIDASPVCDPGTRHARVRRLLEGDVPSPVDPPPGCRFHTRCPVARPRCAHDVPPLAPLDSQRASACHFAAEAESWLTPQHGSSSTA